MAVTTATMAIAGIAGVGALGSLGSAFSQAQAFGAQADFQKQVYDINSKIAEYQATDALKQGERAVETHKRETRSLIGSQRVSMAAQGIDIEDGSALDVQASTRTMSDLDVVTIRSNAYRQAWGYKTQALDASMRGQFAQISGQMQASSTMLTGGINALSHLADGFGNYAKNKQMMDLQAFVAARKK